MSVVGREGIAYVEAVNTVLVRPSFSGWWERGEDLRPDGPDDFTVTYQQWDDLDEGTEWASRRSAQVSLRVDTFSYPFRARRVGDLVVYLRAPVVSSSRFFSVGVEWFTGDREDVEPWPRPVRSRESDREPGYGGVVMLVSSVDACQLVATQRYDVRWEAARDEETLGTQMIVQETATGLDEDAAIAWGRQRARIVLVCLGNMDFEYFSAGEAQLSGIDIPAWDSRLDNPTRLANDQRGWTHGMKRGRRFPIASNPDHDLDGPDDWTS